MSLTLLLAPLVCRWPRSSPGLVSGIEGRHTVLLGIGARLSTYRTFILAPSPFADSPGPNGEHVGYRTSAMGLVTWKCREFPSKSILGNTTSRT